MRIVLVQPEIPQNTGSIARLAAAIRTPLDLVGPLGVSLDDKHLKRAGLDYWPLVDVVEHPDWPSYSENFEGGRLLAFSARAVSPYTECEYRTDDRLVFGCESTGLGPELLELADPHIYRIPIVEEGVRSLNLSNAVSIVVYEARRQLGL
ncbi:MAG: tRNA (cytidine(34)-2'-O)-methyltransferase [Deltaproteobacteria bacterium]